MTAFLAELKKLSTDLDSLKAKWALVGAMACSIYIEPRTTKDIDIAVVTAAKEDIEDLSLALLKRGYNNKQLLMHVGPTHRMGIRLSIPTGAGYDIPVDLLTDSCGIEKEIVEAAEVVELLPSVSLPVASLGHLLAMKTLAMNDFDRIQDKVDAMALIKEASEADLVVAKEALDRITERGHSRGKNLIQELNALISDPLQKK